MDDSEFSNWIGELEARLAGLDKRLVRWMDEPVDISRFEEEIARITAERRESSEYQEALEEVRQTIEGMCRTYLSADEEQASRIRAVIISYGNMLHSLTGYIGHAAERLDSTRDEEWLRIGLAAASIENASIDMRDTILALERLYRKAEELGMDAQARFGEVAGVSSDQPASGVSANTSMRVLLERFHERM